MTTDQDKFKRKLAEGDNYCVKHDAATSANSRAWQEKFGTGPFDSETRYCAKCILEEIRENKDE